MESEEGTDWFMGLINARYVVAKTVVISSHPSVTVLVEINLARSVIELTLWGWDGTAMNLSFRVSNWRSGSNLELMNKNVFNVILLIFCL